MTRMEFLTAMLIVDQLNDCLGNSSDERIQINKVFCQANATNRINAQELRVIWDFIPITLRISRFETVNASLIIENILARRVAIQTMHDTYKKTGVYARLELRKAIDNFKWSFIKELKGKPLYEYGTCNDGPARRNRKTGEVQFVLRESAYNDGKDHWHRMGDGWETKFIPEKKVRL